MIKLKNIILPVLLVIMACDNDFEEINTNPNAPTSVDISSLFAHAQRVAFDDGSFYNEALLHTYTWTQQFSNKSATNDIFQRNEFAVNVNNSYWSQFYISKMPNIIDMKRQLARESTEEQAIHINQRAIVDIMQVLNTHFVVDAFGGIPYSEAFNAFNFDDQNFLPKYDTQQEVYSTMLSQLKAASEALTTDPNQEMFLYDLWYAGDISKWKKLANSLRLRLAMRISDADESLARSVINDLLSNPGDLISSNDDNLVFRYVGSVFDSPLYGQTTQFFHETGAAKNFVEFLQSSADPRLRIFFNQATEGSGSGTFVGVPVSPDDRDAAALFAPGSTKDYSSKYSRGHAQAWFNTKFPEFIINYAEVLLLRAEIAQKGWSNENAEQMYNDGIRASIEFYSALYKEGIPYGDTKNPTVATDKSEILDASNFDVTTTEVEALLTAPGVAYNPTDAINQIGVQQWINHHRNPRELMSNFRRTDIPNGTSTPAWEAIVANGTAIPYANIPKRLTYPATEYASNTTNVNDFVAIQGADQESTRLWWDIN